MKPGLKICGTNSVAISALISTLQPLPIGRRPGGGAVLLLLNYLKRFLLGCAVALAGGFTAANASDDVASHLRAALKSPDPAVVSREALALRRWMIANDPHYPKYHFVGPESWINDPNGPIYYQGKYHLFYQFDPMVPDEHGGWRRSTRCWGHAVSSNLVHWADWPVALWPDTPQDRGGVYSGNTFVADNGDLCALYTGNVRGHNETYGILARSTNSFVTCSKKVVMDDKQRPNLKSPVHWDGFVWKEGNTWCQLVGGTTGDNNAQGAAWLWTSPDLERWTLQTNIAPTIKLGAFWELPYLIRLGGKHVLLVGQGNPYWIGDYDRHTMTFRPDHALPRQVDTGAYYSFNLNMTDRKGPGGTQRRLMHGWVTGPPSPTKAVPYWQGAHSVPRVLRLEGDRLWQEPIPEIGLLRGKHFTASQLPQVRGDAFDITATFESATAKTFGIKVRVSADGKEFTRIFFDSATRRFGVDGSTPTRNAVEFKSAGRRGVHASGSVESLLPAGQPVTMRILLDRSIVEVCVNGVAYTARTFPPGDALSLESFAEGGEAAMKSLDIYEIKSAWE